MNLQDNDAKDDKDSLPMSFPPIGEDDSAQDQGKPGLPAGDKLPDIEALRSELTTLRESYEKQRQRDQELIDRLIQGQRPQVQPDPMDAPVKFDDLPDPVDKPEDFRRTLAQKFEMALAQRERRQSVMSQQQALLDGMWNRFQTEHPDLAKRPALVQGAAAIEATALRQSGIDMDAYLRSNPDGFLSRVVQRMRAELGMEATTPKDSGRTVGVSGGTVSQAKAPAAPKAPSFMEQMRKFQAEDGLY